jgi:hypothetical protein
VELKKKLTPDILVIRGAAEELNSTTPVYKQLVGAGFDATSIVEIPSVDFTSGMIIAGRRGLFLMRPRQLTFADTVIAMEVSIVGPGTFPEFKILALSLETHNQALRLDQLSMINEKLTHWQVHQHPFIVLGGFFGNVLQSKERSALIDHKVNVTEVFSAIPRSNIHVVPLYTSWTGHFTDSMFVSDAIVPAIEMAQIWHAEVDSLPIVVDLKVTAIRLMGSRNVYALVHKYRKLLTVSVVFIAVSLVAFFIAFRLAARMDKEGVDQRMYEHQRRVNGAANSVREVERGDVCAANPPGDTQSICLPQQKDRSHAM